MPRTKIDYSRVYLYTVDNTYRVMEGSRPSWRDQILGSYQVKQYKKLHNQGKGRITSIGKNKVYFTKGTRFTNGQGHLQNWAKPMNLRGGSNPNYAWSRPKYIDSNGVVRNIGTKQYWGSDVNRHKAGVASKFATFNGAQWIRHLQIALYQISLQAENFRVMVGRRALKVFQNSFREQKFHSNKGRRWPSLAPYTLKKRARRGTGSRILREYGDLLNSIKVEDRANPFTTRVYTDIVPANSAHYKKHSICYAGYHNEGKGRYGASTTGHIPKAYVKRKFMGHSSHLSPILDTWLRKMMKQYLFDSVFQVKK